jgi:predicted GIY-YIG superfamily endonuclease
MTLGTVYLLHFDRPYHHARHYIGFTRDLGRRIARHRDGRGSPLIEAASNAGIEFTVARVWHNVTGRFERRVHHMMAKLLCPLCTGRRQVRPARPRISDYQEYEEYPENLEYHGHWEYQPLE